MAQKKRKGQDRLSVQVGDSWTEGIKVSVNTQPAEQEIKLTVLKRFSGIGILSMASLNIYGMLYSQEILKEVLSFDKYLITLIVVWATGTNITEYIKNKHED